MQQPKEKPGQVGTSPKVAEKIVYQSEIDKNNWDELSFLVVSLALNNSSGHKKIKQTKTIHNNFSKKHNTVCKRSLIVLIT